MKIAIKCPMYLDQLGMEGLKYSTIVVFKVEIRGNDTRDGAKSENLGRQVVMRHAAAVQAPSMYFAKTWASATPANKWQEAAF